MPMPRRFKGPFRDFVLELEPPHGLHTLWASWHYDFVGFEDKSRAMLHTIEIRWSGAPSFGLTEIGALKQTSRRLVIGDMALVHSREGRDMHTDNEYSRGMTAMRRAPFHAGAYRLDTGDTAFSIKLGFKEARFAVTTSPGAARLTRLEAG